MKHIHTPKHMIVLLVFVISILFSFQPTSIFLGDLEVGSISKKDIIAPKTITYVDEKATEELKVKALSEVENIYDKDPKVNENLFSSIDAFLTSIEAYKKERDNKDIEPENKMKIKEINNVFELSEQTLATLTTADEGILYSFVDYIRSEISKVYQSGVTEEQLTQTKEILLSDSNLYLFPKILRSEFYTGILSHLKPNFTLNSHATDKLKEEKLASIEPVYKKVTKGEAVIRKYEEITAEHLGRLELLGMTKTEFDAKEFFSALPIILFFSILLHVYLNKFVKEDMKSIRKYAITLFSISLSIYAFHLLQSTDYYLIPILTLLIIFVVFWSKHFIVIVSVFLSAILSSGDPVLLLLILISGTSLVTFYNKFKDFTDAIKSGFFIGVIISIASFILYYTFDQRLISSEFIFAMIVSGISSGIVANGLIPLIEKTIGVSTVYKLTGLNSYEHPLLEELYSKANGTYDHSRNVAHLVTLASNKLGTNSLLLRVAALYHDIGKMENPEYFIENSSPEENIHNHMNPVESAKIITNHPIKSAEICRKHKIPQDVIDVFLPHHGDSTLAHFMAKAKEQGIPFKPEDFQYETKPPKTKEQSILLLADSVEAYSRTLEYETYDELRELLMEFIDRKLNSGVLRESELTLKEITICIDEFCKALLAMHHKRVKYN